MPKGFPSIDDHVWDIVIRRYGGTDQMADVFTTLAGYIGHEAFFEGLRISEAEEALVLSFVRIDNEWHMFDVYNKRPFISIEDLTIPTPYGLTYGEYLESMDKTLFQRRIRRPGKQAPFTRIIYEVRKIFKSMRLQCV